MSSYYQESNTSAIYRDYTFNVSLSNNYNSIKTYTNFNNQVPLPTYNSKKIDNKQFSSEQKPKTTLYLPNINPY